MWEVTDCEASAAPRLQWRRQKRRTASRGAYGRVGPSVCRLRRSVGGGWAENVVEGSRAVDLLGVDCVGSRRMDAWTAMDGKVRRG